MSRPPHPPLRSPAAPAAAAAPSGPRPPFERWGWLAALLVALPSVATALLPGWFEGHDDLHIVRLIEYDRALWDGQVPPRWFADVSAGHGSPHPLYYAPLFYLIAEVFHLGGLGIVGSLKAAVCVVMLGGSLSMYGLARALIGSAASLVAAAAYTYAPYHLLDLYVRQAFSELTVFAVLPALLLCLLRLRERGGRLDVAAGALATAATATAHTITAMIAPPLAGAYAVLLCRGLPAARRRAFLGRAALALAIGGALAGFFLVPLVAEREAIDASVFRTGYFDYRKHFVEVSQLLWSPWGFGTSVDGAAEGMSFRLGSLQWLGIVGAAASLPALRRKRAETASQGAFFLGVAAVSLAMTLGVSAPIWAAIPPLHFVQFPWRLLTLATLAAGLLCGLVFASVERSRLLRRGSGAAALGVSGLLAALAAAGGALGVNLRVPSVSRIGIADAAPAQLVDRGEAAAAASPTRLDTEFVRRHAVRWFDHLPRGAYVRGVTAADLSRPRVEVQSGKAIVSEVIERTGLVAFRAVTSAGARLRVNVWRFPGWTAEVDGAVVPIVQEPRQRAVVLLDVGPGSHAVRVAMRRTPPRLLGDALTLAAIAGLAALGLPARRRGRGDGKAET